MTNISVTTALPQQSARSSHDTTLSEILEGVNQKYSSINAVALGRSRLSTKFNINVQSFTILTSLNKGKPQGIYHI